MIAWMYPPTWKEVLHLDRVPRRGLAKARALAHLAGYPYISYNGRIYRVLERGVERTEWHELQVR